MDQSARTKEISATEISHKNKKLRRKLFFIVRLTVGILILLYIVWSVDKAAVAKSLTSIQPIFLLSLLFIVSSRGLLRAYKWNLLLHARGVMISVFETLRLNYVGQLFGSITPGGLGTEAYRVSALSRFQKNQAIISTILLERGIGLVILGAFAAIGLPISTNYLVIDSPLLFWPVILGTTIATALVIVSLYPPFFNRITCIIPFLSKTKIFEKIRGFYQIYAESRNHWRTLLAFTALAGFEVVLMIGTTYLAARSIKINIPFSYLFCTIPLLFILLRLPISIEGIGIQEGLYAYLFVLAGFTAADGLTVSLLLRFVGLLIVYLPAFVMLCIHPLRLNSPQ